MGLFDWISKQVDKQVERIQQAEKEKLEAQKKWLVNPYGMDPQLQKRLVAEATKKREDEFSSQSSQLPQLFDPQADYQKKLAEYNVKKAKEEEEKKKHDEEFEARRRQRIALQRSQTPAKRDRVPSKAALAASDEVNSAPVSKSSAIPDSVARVPSVSSIVVPILESEKSSPSEDVEKAIAKILAVKPLVGDIISEHSLSQNTVNHPTSTPVAVETSDPVPGSLAFLRDDPVFLQIREAIHQNHELLFPFLEKIKVENPRLALHISRNEEEFRSLLAETSNPVFQLPPHLQFLEHDSRLLSLRRKIQRRPERLGWAMRKLVEEHPDLAAILACNEAQFIEWLNVGSSVRIGTVVEGVDSSTPAGFMAESSTLPNNNLDFLRENNEFLRMRATYQARPEMLKWLAGKFIAGNPDLKNTLVSNEAEFIKLMNEGFVPPTESGYSSEMEDFDGQYLSPLSQRIRQAEENGARNSVTNFEKRVRFTDNVIRGDNNMDFSPLDKALETEMDLGNPDSWTMGSVNSQGASGSQAGNGWSTSQSPSTSPFPPSSSLLSTPRCFNGSATQASQYLPGFGANISQPNSGMSNTSYPGSISPTSSTHMPQPPPSHPIAQPQNNSSSTLNIFAPNPMFKAPGTLALPTFDPSAIAASIVKPNPPSHSSMSRSKRRRK